MKYANQHYPQTDFETTIKKTLFSTKLPIYQPPKKRIRPRPFPTTSITTYEVVNTKREGRFIGKLIVNTTPIVRFSEKTQHMRYSVFVRELSKCFQAALVSSGLQSLC